MPKTNNNKTQAKRSGKAVKKDAPKTKVPQKAEPAPTPRKKIPADSRIHGVLPFVFVALALFLTVCFVSAELTGIMGTALSSLLYGLFGAAAYCTPVLLVILAFMWRKEAKRGKATSLLICQALFLIFFSAMIHLWTKGSLDFALSAFWKNGELLSGGGVVGGILGVTLYKLTGSVGTHIIGLSVLTVTGLFMVGLTPYNIYIWAVYNIREAKRRRAEEMPAPVISDKPEVDDTDDEAHPRVKRDPNNKHHFEPADDGIPPFDIDGEGYKPENTKESGKDQSKGKSGKEILDDTFVDPDELEVLKRFAEEQKKKAETRTKELGNAANAEDSADGELELTRDKVVEDKKEEIKPEYKFPPISLLKLDTSPKNVDITEELQSNAVKLVESLRSFKVRTRIVNVSRGPTITRYELAPEEGVRVRAIANLVDDISLSLATTGVRIEAPIPGKAAVGIEVPNKHVETVYLRDLVDNEAFKKASSKLTVSLGKDVAGDLIYFNIADMPHLLIAGATGMGKSVCINSLIVSLLYKASPDEVKLILIDPKKVELNVYNGLPHLLVPVVSDPKKAAGSLHWAVTEMERRFELIEDAGVRNIKNYNIVTKDDPEKEFLPHIVIIIDELADLMMTAPDDVEDSICRLAQKARAAGMHLIIGTQRPSVDVITGLIKANVPSRIAFTVASQTDSRVVLDSAGAEKLIGRGDMLFAPVGAAKPIRVQGAFVSEKEVEAIVSSIKENNGKQTEYSSDIIESIDRAAASCGSGKKGGGDDGGELGEADPMLRPAIELALESGKISTSLIQRRLALGYGRAAKLIDEMERRGFVSPPEGQKPRSVLITKQQYMEMVVNRDEDLD